MHSLVLLLALAQPAEVLEEWTLLDTAPLSEVLTARVVYVRDSGPEIALPSVFDRETNAPTVELVGHLQPLTVTRVDGTWRATLPARVSTARPRVVVRAVRRVPDVRLFQASWPRAIGEAIRRVAIVPRGWMQGVSEGWTCADDSIATVACVSIDTTPKPLQMRVAPWPTTRGAWLATAALLATLLALVTTISTAKTRLVRVASWGASLLACASVALTVVGARWLPWSAALSIAGVCATALALLVNDDAVSRRVAATSVLALSLLAVFDARPWVSIAALFLASIAIVAARLAIRASQRPAESDTDPRSSAAAD